MRAFLLYLLLSAEATRAPPSNGSFRTKVNVSADTAQAGFQMTTQTVKGAFEQNQRALEHSEHLMQQALGSTPEDSSADLDAKLKQLEQQQNTTNEKMAKQEAALKQLEVHDHDNVYAPLAHDHDIAADLDAKMMQLEENTKAELAKMQVHHHDNVYAPLAHDHDGWLAELAELAAKLEHLEEKAATHSHQEFGALAADFTEKHVRVLEKLKHLEEKTAKQLAVVVAHSRHNAVCCVRTLFRDAPVPGGELGFATALTVSKAADSVPAIVPYAMLPIRDAVAMDGNSGLEPARVCDEIESDCEMKGFSPGVVRRANVYISRVSNLSEASTPDSFADAEL
jgi:hypothetical protein